MTFMEDKSLDEFLKHFDQTLYYATRHEEIAPEWIDICLSDKSKWSAEKTHRAYVLFQKAAHGGSAFAMCMCCDLCAADLGIKNFAEAFEWAKRAMQTGSPIGHFKLGGCYQAGIGTSTDNEKARMHYKIAYETGFGLAAFYLALMYESGAFGKVDMVMAIECAKVADQLDEPWGGLKLANWFEEGKGVIPNEREALRWYEKAAESGNYFANARLNSAYQYGELGVTKDLTLARKYELAANHFQNLLEQYS